MKIELVEKRIHEGRLADELKRSEGFKTLLQRGSEKRDQKLKEAVGSKSYDELRYNAGFIDGLEFLMSMTDQWSQRAKKVKNA